MNIKVTEHIRTLDEVRKEGKFFGRYKSRTEVEYPKGYRVTIYYEYMKAWGTGEKMVKIWSFGNRGENFVTEAIPYTPSNVKKAELALWAKLRGEK